MLEKIISFRGVFSLLDSSSTIQIIAISKVHTESAVPRSDFNLDALVSATIQVKTNFYEITKEFYIPSPLHCFLNVKKDEFFNTMHIDELEEFGLQWAFNNKLYKGNERGLRATFVAGLTGVCYPFTPIKVQERLIKLIDALFAQDDELDRSDEGCKLVISRELQISNSKLFNLISNVSKKSIEIRTPLTTWQYYYERQIDDFLKSDYPTLIMHLVNDLKIDETNVCVLFYLTLDYFNDYDFSFLMTSIITT